MKVKIIKCSNPNYWYYKHIGEVYNVQHYANSNYYHIKHELGSYRNNNSILKEDCEIVEEEKHQFQIGDEVIYCNANWFIENIDLQDRYYLISPSGSVHLYSVDHKDVKPIAKIVEKEKEMFDLKKEKWFIRTPTPEISKVVQEWLFKQGTYWRDGSKKVTSTHGVVIGRSRPLDYEGFGFDHSLDFYKKEGCKEIKLTFKTVVDSVEYPEVKSEAQVEFEKLQEQIKQLQEQADIVKSKL